MSRPRIKERDNLRTERISLALTPVALSGITTLAQIKEISVNDLICGLIDNVIKKNAAVISDFNTARDKAASAVKLNVDAETN